MLKTGTSTVVANLERWCSKMKTLIASISGITVFMVSVFLITAIQVKTGVEHNLWIQVAKTVISIWACMKTYRIMKGD